MTLEHVCAELMKIAFAQRPGAEEDALDFAAHVISTLKLTFGELLAAGFKQRKIN